MRINRIMNSRKAYVGVHFTDQYLQPLLTLNTDRHPEVQQSCVLQYPDETDLKKAHSAVNLARENRRHFESKPVVATVNFYSGNDQFTAIKKKSIRKLSNFNFQFRFSGQNPCTRIIRSYCIRLFSLSRAMNVICYVRNHLTHDDFTCVFAIPVKFEIYFLFGVISYNLVHL